MVSHRLPRINLLLAALFAAILPLGEAVPAVAASLPPTVQFVPAVSGLSLPVFVTGARDGSHRLFIVQQSGQIKIFKAGSLLSTPFLNIAGLVPDFTGVNGEQGLLSLAFDPNFLTNRFFYITYTTNTTDPTFKYTTTLARYQVSSGNPDVADPSSGTVLLTIPKKYTNHNGGMLAFGPDGDLYLGMGDGGSGGDPDGNGQNLDTLLAKILRLDVTSTPPPGKKYVIPPTNPFYGSSDPNVKKEIWAYGVRNPWRFSFDRSTGDFYIADVGQNIEEEVDFQAAGVPGGQNYGWNILEGNLCYNPSTNCTPPSGYVPPVTTYDHGPTDAVGCSVTGGYVYRGSVSPSLQGVYLYGDFCSGRVLGLVRNPNGTWNGGLLALSNFNISSFGQDDDGELYVIDYSHGTVYHISTDTTSLPTVTAFYPANGSQACPRPAIGVNLDLSGLVEKSGSFDPSTIMLTLDGQDVTSAATIVQTNSAPSSFGIVRYTPPTDLALGSHAALLALRNPPGQAIGQWSFTVANIVCPASSQLSPAMPEPSVVVPVSPSGTPGPNTPISHSAVGAPPR